MSLLCASSSLDMELKSAPLSCTCRHNLLQCGLSYSSSSPFMRSNMSSLPSLACHVCQLAILSTRLSSRAPCTKTSCPSLFAAAKSCNTEFLRFFLGVYRLQRERYPPKSRDLHNSCLRTKLAHCASSPCHSRVDRDLLFHILLRPLKAHCASRSTFLSDKSYLPSRLPPVACLSIFRS